MSGKRFPSPFEIETPAGAEGWEEMYSYSVVFSEDRRAYEESMFWFQDSMHWGWAMTPWDATLMLTCIASMSQYNSRHYIVPPATGIDMRVLNGYCYLTPVELTDGPTIESRVPDFLERAGYYFQNWNDLYAQWLESVKANIAELEAIDFSPLPEKEDLSVVTDRKPGSGWRLQAEYHRFKDLVLRIWQLHFEFLNLGYAAYLDYFGFCKQAFPNIPDLAIARMVAGIEVDLFRPNEELKSLAQSAVDLDLADVFKDEDPDKVQEALRSSEAGRQWQAQWEAVEEPWFNFSDGTGFYYFDRTWREKLDVPYGFLRNYIEKIQRGEDISRPIEEIEAERDRIVAEYSELLATDEDRAAFESKLGLARVVFPYVENHNFYIEHWSCSVFWRKLRELGAVFLKEGFIEREDDLYLFKSDEIDDALWDMYMGWASATEPRGPHYWPPTLARRREIFATLKQWKLPRALGATPTTVTEPFTVMLWGITSDSVSQWLGGDESSDGAVTGMAAAPGVVEGIARIVRSAEDIGDLQDGEVMVAPITAPAWAPAFSRVVACVTDIGGVMSHAAIVCREYGVPAVTGTVSGTTDIRTGQRIRVDGTAGKVTILD